MNFNVFNNWAVWGVIDDDDDEQKSSSKQEKEQQQQPKQIESEKNVCFKTNFIFLYSRKKLQ